MHSGRNVNYAYLAASALLFIFGVVLGAFVPKTETPLSESPLFEVLSPYVELYKPYELSTVLFLFSKNSLTVGIAFFLSPLLLVFPTLILILNGFMTGFVLSVLPLDLAIKALAPHGIFELPALVLAAAGGMRFGVAVIRKVIRKLRGGKYNVSSEFKKGLKLFMLSLALLFVAAIVETYITPLVLGFSP